MFQERRLTSSFIVKASLVNHLTADHQIIFAHDCYIKVADLDFFCFNVREEENIAIVQRAQSDQFVDMQSSVVRIDFAKVSHINHNVTVYRNFNIFALLYVEDIVMILNMMLTHQRDELLITSDKVFLHFFLMLMKLE